MGHTHTHTHTHTHKLACAPRFTHMYDESVKAFLRASIMDKDVSRRGRVRPGGWRSERVSVGGKAKKQEAGKKKKRRRRRRRRRKGRQAQVSLRHRWQGWKERG